MFTKTENHLSNQACNRTSGEPCAVKVASTVRRGGIGKVLRQLACSLPNQVVLVKRKYNLTMNQAEASTAQRVLANCPRPIVMQFTEGGEPPVEGGNALELYDDNNNGRITCAEARAHGIAPVPRGHPAYQYMRDGDGDGVVCE